MIFSNNSSHFCSLLILFTLLLLTTLPTCAQNDTIWYGMYGYKTIREKAFSFSLKFPKTDGGYRVEEFYLSGAKKMEGLSLSSDGSSLDGWAIWYNKNGDISHKKFYTKGNLEKYISYWQGEEFATAEYQNDQFIKGTILVYDPLSGTNVIQSHEEGRLLSVLFFENDLKGIRYGYTLRIDSEGDTLRQYEFYDEEGELLGKYECVDLEYEMYGKEEDKFKKNGTFVDYYFDPLQVGAIIRYKNGKVLNRKDYYRTGELRQDLIADGDSATTKYYKPDGTLLGKFTAPYDPVYDRFKRGGTGTKVHFYSDSESKTTPVKKIVKLKDGKDIEYRSFTTTGTLQQLIKYSENGGRIEQHFDEKGKFVQELIWRNHAPYHGTCIVRKGHHKIYKDGEVVEEIDFYKSGEKFRHKEGTKETYYDKQGKVIARAKYESFESEKPLKGTVISLLLDEPDDEKHYLDGEMVKKVQHFHSKKTDRISKKVTFYEDRVRAREQWYYSTGALQSDLLFDGYISKKATYYDKEGNIIGELKKVDGKKTGTEIDFHYESDFIRAITTYNELGEVVSEKKYAMFYDKNRQPYTMLIAQISANGTSKYYEHTGELIGEAEFREGKAVSGVVVEPCMGGYIATPYEAGEKHGIEKKYQYLIKDSDLPVLVAEKSYKNGQLHGESTYYDEEGNLKSQHSFRMGKPYDGVFIRTNSSFYEKTVLECKYDKGKLDYCTVTVNDSLVERTTFADGLYETIKYDENRAEALTILLDEDENGTIVFHNRKNGTGKNIIENGKPVSGAFYCTDFYKSRMKQYGEADLLEVVFQPDSWQLTAFDAEGKEIFQLTERKNWEESTAISQYLWVEEYLDKLSYFYKYKSSVINYKED